MLLASTPHLSLSKLWAKTKAHLSVTVWKSLMGRSSGCGESTVGSGLFGAMDLGSGVTRGLSSTGAGSGSGAGAGVTDL